MLNNILDLEGVTTLNKDQKQSIKAGLTYYGASCAQNCAGSCSGGYCYQMLY